MSSSQSMNITIPRVLGQVPKEVIVQAFRKQQLGRLVDVQRYERVNENGHAYWFAFMQYIPADTPNARTFVQLLKSGKKTFVFYQSNSPWKMNVQFPALTTNEKRDPFVEVVMHVRELARVNPAALVRLPIAAKKGYAVVQGTVVHRPAVPSRTAGGATPKKTQRRPRQSNNARSNEWITVGQLIPSEPASEPTTEPVFEPASEPAFEPAAVQDVECEWEFEPVPSEPYMFAEDEDDLTQLLQDIEKTRTAAACWSWNANSDLEWTNEWNQILCNV